MNLPRFPRNIGNGKVGTQNAASRLTPCPALRTGLKTSELRFSAGFFGHTR